MASNRLASNNMPLTGEIRRDSSIDESFSTKIWEPIASLPRVWEYLLSEYDKDRYTRLHIAVVFQEGVEEILNPKEAREEGSDMVKKFEYLHARTSKGWTALHLAVVLGNDAILKNLMDAYDSIAKWVADPKLNRERVRLPSFDFADCWWMTPLHYAVLGNLQTPVTKLLKWDLYKEHVNARDFFKRTPLHMAACHHLVSVEPFLEKELPAKVDFHAIDSVRHSPLHWAICFAKEEAVNHLVEKSETVEAIEMDIEGRSVWEIITGNALVSLDEATFGTHSSNQSPNQSPNQLPNQSPNQPPNQLPNRSPNQPPNQPPNRSPNQPPNQLPNQSLNQSPNQFEVQPAIDEPFPGTCLMEQFKLIQGGVRTKIRSHLQRIPAVKAQAERTQKSVQMYVAANSAVIVAASLIASASFGGTSPDLSASSFGGPSPGTSPDGYEKDGQHLITTYIVWRSGAFYFAILALIASFITLHSLAKVFPGRSQLKNITFALKRITRLLGCSVACFLAAFYVSNIHKMSGERNSSILFHFFSGVGIFWCVMYVLIMPHRHEVNPPHEYRQLHLKERYAEDLICKLYSPDVRNRWYWTLWQTECENTNAIRAYSAFLVSSDEKAHRDAKNVNESVDNGLSKDKHRLCNHYSSFLLDIFGVTIPGTNSPEHTSNTSTQGRQGEQPQAGSGELALRQSLHGEQALGQSSHGEQTLGQITHGEQTLGQSSHGEQTLGQSSHGEQTLGQSSHGEQTLGQSSHGEQTLGQSSHGEQTLGQISHGELGQRSREDRAQDSILTQLGSLLWNQSSNLAHYFFGAGTTNYSDHHGINMARGSNAELEQQSPGLAAAAAGAGTRTEGARADIEAGEIEPPGGGETEIEAETDQASSQEQGQKSKQEQEQEQKLKEEQKEKLKQEQEQKLKEDQSCCFTCCDAFCMSCFGEHAVKRPNYFCPPSGWKGLHMLIWATLKHLQSLWTPFRALLFPLLWNLQKQESGVTFKKFIVSAVFGGHLLESYSHGRLYSSHAESGAQPEDDENGYYATQIWNRLHVSDNRKERFRLMARKIKRVEKVYEEWSRRMGEVSPDGEKSRYFMRFLARLPRGILFWVNIWLYPKRRRCWPRGVFYWLNFWFIDFHMVPKKFPIVTFYQGYVFQRDIDKRDDIAKDIKTKKQFYEAERAGRSVIEVPILQARLQDVDSVVQS